MRLLLDKVVLIFAVESTQRLTKRATTLLQCRKHPSAERISLFEIACKTARGKLRPAEVKARRAIEDLARLLPIQRLERVLVVWGEIEKRERTTAKLSPRLCAKRSRWSLAMRNSTCTKDSQSSSCRQPVAFGAYLEELSSHGKS